MTEATADEFGLAGQRLEGRYDVDRVVAAGGFGTVYHGRHRALRNEVAVKVLRVPGHLMEAERHEFAQHFLAEAQTLAQLQHPAVVRALDFGVSAMPNGVTAPWAALEWVDGETLADLLARRRGAPMAPREALAMLRPVLEALALAHGLGIAHRDVKPANIMIPRAPTGPTVSRVLDFGIAKTMRPEESASPSGVTQTGGNMKAFSLKYAAPEQVSGLRTGPWTDVHALALVLTEMVAGCAAYAGDDVMSVAAAVLRERRPTPGALGIDVGPWEAALARALAFRPGDRHPHAGALLDDLAARLPHADVALAPPALAPPPAASFDRTAASAPPVARTAPALQPAARGNAGPVLAASAFAALLVLAAVGYALTRGTSPAASPRPDVAPSAALTPPASPPPASPPRVAPPDEPLGAQVTRRNPWVTLPDGELSLLEHEVTAGEYRLWRMAAGDEGAAVVGVAWADASAYCAALGAGARLPTQAEWRRALGGRRWVSRVRLARALGDDGGDVAPSGVRDLVGGVREWVADEDGAGHRVMGAAATDPADEKLDRTTAGDAARDASDAIGFRCAQGGA